jgi:nucleotide-binding universal stress UspA family protein
MADLKKSAEKNFKKMKEKWAANGPAVHAFIEYGATTPTIRQFVEDNKIDLVIMGTHGASGIKEFLIGSNTEKIVRMVEVPVIAVKKPVKQIKHIVFPNVLSREQEDLTMKVKSLQNFFGATLNLVYINTPALFKRDAETREAMRSFAKRYMLKDYTINIYNDISEEEGITNFAKEIKADLVAMGTHGRRGISHLMMGSVAEDVVNHIDCPIWTYKSK